MTSYPIPIRRLEDPRVYRRDQPLLTEDDRLCMVAERLSPWPSVDVFHGLPWLTPVLGSGCLDLGDGPRLDRVDVEGAARRWAARAELELPPEFGDPGRVAWDFVSALETDRRTQADRDASPSGTIPVADSTAGLALLTALLTWLYPAIRMVTGSPASRWWTQEHAVALAGTRGEHDLRPARQASLTVLKRLLNEEDGLGLADAAVRRLLKSIRRGLEQRRIALDELRVLTEVTWLNLIEGSSIYPGWSDLLLRLVIRYSDRQPPSGVHPNLVELTQLGARVAELLQPATADSWKDHVAGGAMTRRTHLYRAIARLLSVQAEIFSMLHQPDPISDDPAVQATLTPQYEAAEDLAESVADDSRSVLEEVDPKRDVGRPVVPHPACFVTSFDIELEMALWLAGAPFRVVLPVLVSSRAGQSAELVWLVADFDPPGSTASSSPPDNGAKVCTDEVAEPADTNESHTQSAEVDGPPIELTDGSSRAWRVASTVLEASVGGDRPVVVRLSGTPLITLPSLRQATPLVDELRAAGIPRPHSLCHALTIDEYTSMRFSESEWFFAGQASLPPKAGALSASSEANMRAEKARPRRDLPSCLASSTRTNERIWLALGVQLDDPAIRSRLLSQFSAAAVVRRIHGLSRDDEKETAVPAIAPDVRGIAVNRRMDEDEAIALHWLGFDLALDTDCGNLTPEIVHCSEHLDAVRRALVQRQHGQSDSSTGSWNRANEGACELRPEVGRR